MTGDGMLDLTAVESDRRPVKIDDGEPVFMASPDALGPRDFARISAMDQAMGDVSAESFDGKVADEWEARMTEAAQVVLPDTPRERIAAMPFMRRAKLVQAFTGGLGTQPSAPEPVNREERRAASTGDG